MTTTLPHVVLIHGINATSHSMEPLAEGLRKYATVHAPNLPGHGGSPVPEHMTTEGTAAALLQMLDQQGVERAVFVGYSHGGYTATWLALHHPERVTGVCAIATRLIFSPEDISHWLHLGHPDRMSRPGNPRAGQLLQMHGPDWRSVAMASLGMIEGIGRDPPIKPADIPAIARPMLLVNGNRDVFLPWENTLGLGKIIPGAKLVMFLGIAHPVMNLPAAQIGEAIGQWMKEIGA